MIELNEVVYDIRARDGTWCALSYPGHPKGCPNFPWCPAKHKDFKTIEGNYVWYAVIEEFDLASHAEKMKRIHPAWSERQCRNLLYWQGLLRVRLERKAMEVKFKFKPPGVILNIPEACGIDVFETMSRIGVKIDRYPDVVRKVMLIGKEK